MNISELPTSLQADARKLLNPPHDKQVQEGALSRIFSWLQNDGYDLIVDYVFVEDVL